MLSKWVDIQISKTALFRNGLKSSMSDFFLLNLGWLGTFSAMITVIGLLLVGRGSEGHIGKWAPYFSCLLVGAGSLITLTPSFVRKNRGRLYLRLCLIGVTVLCVTFSWGLFSYYNEQINKNSGFGFAMLLGFTSAISFFIYTQGRLSSDLPKICRGSYFLLIMLFGPMIGCVFYNLPNFFVLNRLVETNSYIKQILATVLIWALWFTILHKQSESQPKQWGVKTRIVQKSLLFLVITFMGFRSSALFLGSGKLHWSYYTGPINSVKNGFQPLWNISSQYGFLNIVFPASLPFESSWQSLYVFQSLLLCLTCFMMCDLVVSKMSHLWERLFLLCSVIFSLYFADHNLIGPSLYPSSSVMRFFPTYLIFYFIVKTYAKISLKSFLIGGSMLWIFAVLWAAEAGIYNTAIYFSSLTVIGFQSPNRTWPEKSWIVLRSIIISFLLMVLVLSGLSFFYQLQCGHFPDFYMLFEHGLSYAGGFGDFKLNRFGAGWVLFLGFAGILNYLRVLLKANPADREIVLMTAALFYLWSISSYFIGRAVSNNIVAMFPQLILIFTVVLLSVKRNGLFAHEHAPVYLAGFIIYFAVWSTLLFNPYLDRTVSKFESFHLNIEKKIEKDVALIEIIHSLSITRHTPLVYYGTDAGIPLVSDKEGDFIPNLIWYPSPLQLKEDPIKFNRQKILISRTVNQIPTGGYFIQRRLDPGLRSEEWFTQLKPYFEIKTAGQNNQWIIYHFVKKAS